MRNGSKTSQTTLGSTLATKEDEDEEIEEEEDRERPDEEEENQDDYSEASTETASVASVHTGFRYWVQDGEIVRSRGFTIFINVTIAINAVVIGLETDLSCHSTTNCEPDEYVIWNVFEYLFLIIFLAEMILKIIAFSWPGYWQDDWNKFDFFLIMMAILDTWVMAIVGGGGGGLKIFSVLRVLRAFRLVRLVKLLRQFKELYLLVNGMVEACKTLVWVACLLLVILYVIGIIFTILIGQNTDPALKYLGTWSKEDYWGSVPKSMYTFWGSKIARPIIKEYPAYTIFFLVFIFLISFGLMNIVLGVICMTGPGGKWVSWHLPPGPAIICENAIYAASKNTENMQKIVLRHQQLVINSITAIFEAADTDGSGELSREEFDEALSKKAVKQKLELIDVPPDDLRMLFDLLDADGSGEITIDEFRKGCLKLQGTAKSKEMIKLAVHVSTYNSNLDDMQDAMEEQNKTLKKIYNRLYDLEKQYFRHDQTKKPKRHEEEEGEERQTSGKPVSILGAVAAAGRHIAQRRGAMDSEEEAKKGEAQEQAKSSRFGFLQGKQKTQGFEDKPIEADFTLEDMQKM
eukprot:g13677.t1